MHRSRKARLDRLIGRAGDADDAAAERRRALRARAALGAAVRWTLAQSGIDPARAPALRVGDEASAELAVAGDPPAEPAADPAADDRNSSADPLCGLDDRIGRLVACYRDGVRADPDFARASLAELLAWCIAASDGSGSA